MQMQMERNEALFVGDLVEYYLNGGIRAAQCNTYIKGWEIKSALIDHRTQKQSTSIEIGLSQSA
eukprot:scaffold13563_cov20-Cyclotella_meneghiniana.AAC.1